MTSESWLMVATSRTRRVLLALMLGIVPGACQDAAGPDVSGTELWRLELEQVDDGTENVFRQRGTINLRLRLNHTTTPDAACAGRDNPNATTFLASVEAVVSRLQSPASGTATGTWNCHGFSAEVRLDNGTTYALVSDSLKFAADDTLTTGTAMLPNRWTAGARRGHFLLAREDRFRYQPFDSHFDVIVHNRHSRSLTLTLRLSTNFPHRDVGYIVPGRSDSVPVGTQRLSLGLRPAERWVSAPTEPSLYDFEVGEIGGLLSSGITCALGTQRRDEVELIVADGLTPACGVGWVGGIDLRLTPARLFLRPGSAESVVVRANPADTVFVQTADPALQVVLPANRRPSVAAYHDTMVVAAHANAPLREHGVIVTARYSTNNQEALFVLPVEVYDLQVRASPDTITVAAGATVNTTIRLARGGLVGLIVRLSATALPPGVLLAEPSFAPGETRQDSSTLTLRVENTAPGGLHTLTVCATIVRDPENRCHAAQVVLRVVAHTCSTQLQAYYPLNGTGADTSGRGNHGTVQGARPGFNRHSDGESALIFDGIDDSIELGNAFNTLSLPFSVAAWVNQPAAARGDLRAIFVTDDEPGRYAGIWWQIEQSGASSITYADGGPVGGATRRTLTANAPIPTDTWVHLTATVRGPTDMTLYMNGLPVAGTYSGTGGPLLHTNAPARIGNMSIVPGNRPWLGRLDELRVYDCSLAAHEVLGLFDRR